MKRFFFPFFLFFLCAAALSGQSSVWRVSRNGNTLYLAGSVHLLREQDYPLPGEFDAAFNASGILVLETDVESLADSNADYRRYTRLGNGETLEGLLSKKTYRLLEKKAAELSVPMEMIRPLRPAMVVGVFSAFKLFRLGFSRPGVDLYYFEKAGEESKTLMYLESVEDHMAALSAVGDVDAYVFDSLKNLDAAGPELITIIGEWRKGTGEATEGTVREIALQYPETYQAMLVRRNQSWLPLIESCLATPEIEFIIAGAAHFYGPDGLLDLLAARGCRIEQPGLEDF